MRIESRDDAPPGGVRHPPKVHLWIVGIAIYFVM